MTVGAREVTVTSPITSVIAAGVCSRGERVINLVKANLVGSILKPPVSRLDKRPRRLGAARSGAVEMAWDARLHVYGLRNSPGQFVQRDLWELT